MTYTLTPDCDTLLFSTIRTAIMRFAASIVCTGRADLEKRFADIIQQYDDMISRICFGYARTKDEFDDLHQDTLINIWQGLPHFEGKSLVKTWVYRVALNTCVSSVRLKSRKIESVPFYDTFDMPDEDTEQKARIVELHESISRLDSLDKAILMLWLDEYSYDEIADIVGMPRNTIATRLSRAKKKLKKMI